MQEVSDNKYLYLIYYVSLVIQNSEDKLHKPVYIFIQQIYVLNSLNMLHTLRFFSSKCRLFHNSTFFGSCIIHILHTGCAKI